MGSPGASNGGSDTADERKQKTYSQQLDDIQKKKKSKALDNTGADEGFFLVEREKKRKQREEAEKSFREMRGGDNQVVQSPTTSEVSQVTQTEVTTPEVTTPEVEKPEEKEDDILIRKRKTKARGRSPTILTGVTGVTDGLTLGKPSLLGR